MKRFLEMIEYVKSTGVIHNLETESKTSLSHFYETVEKAECLVFYPKNKEPTDIVDKYGEELHVKYDSPFSVFSFEVLGGNITEPHGYREKQHKIISQIGEVENIGKTSSDLNAWIHCVLAWEHTPNVFQYYIYGTLQHPKGENKIVLLTNTLDRLTKEFIERINREELGSEATRQRIKIGTGKDKRIHTVRRIIHIKPKKYMVTSSALFGGGKIEFSHRFVRRGTWVSLPGRVGKDRSGNYCVSDWTWRVETIVGPEDKPLIRKTRVINEKEGSEPRGPKT